MFLNFSGQFFAICSAVLFGVSPVLCKLVIGDMSPALLAGLLYLGSGLGLQFQLLFQRKNTLAVVWRLSPLHRCKLLGSIIFGGILAPLCFAYGIKFGFASETSLLLNLETVATTVIAWLFFKEHVGVPVWIGKVFILLGASLIIIKAEHTIAFSLPGLYIVLACVFWGIDNNLTRDIEDLPAGILASIKGLSAGSFNIMLALVLSTGSATLYKIGITLLIGAVCYGLSLVLFVEALRKIGAARTSTYFAVGPFVGVLFSVLFLGERMQAAYWGASLLMLTGIVFLYREMHHHLHSHERISHSHAHIHDEHHQHLHAKAWTKEPHEHSHIHEPITHVHVHWPDIHHRHRH